MKRNFVKDNYSSLERSDNKKFSLDIGRVDIFIGDKFRVQNRGSSLVLFLSDATFSSTFQKWSDYKSSDGSDCSSVFEGVHILELV